MASIALTKGYIAEVDDADLPRVQQHAWCAFSNGGNQIYAEATIKGKRARLHRFVMEATAGTIVDHKDGNTLNNRRSNLRFVSKSENAINAKVRRNKTHSMHRGITFDSSRNKWVAQFKAHGVKYNLGRFATELEALQAYQVATKDLHAGVVCRA